MAWPYDDEPFAPDVAQRMPEFVMPPVSEPDYLGELSAPQEPMPEDFFARVAQGSGPAPFAPMQLGRNATGLEMLLALAGGFVNAKTRRAAGRISETQERNERARAAAKDLANRRWEMRRIQAQANANLRNILASRKDQPPEALENVIDPKTGKPVKRKRSEAAGMEPAYPPQAPPNMVPMVMPGGELVWGNPKAPPPGSAPPIPRGAKLPASALSDFSDELNTIRQTDDVLSLYQPEFVGPVSGGMRGRFAAKTGRGLKPGEAKFRSAVATYANKARNILFGSALTATEKEEAYKQLPDASNPSEVFEANIEMTRNNLKRANQLRRETYEASGYDLSRFPAAEAPGGGGGAPDDKVKIIRDGVRGTVSRKFLRPTDQVVL